MALPEAVQSYLRKKGGVYQARKVEPLNGIAATAGRAGIPMQRLARGSVVKHASARLMVIFRADKLLDVQELSRRFRRELELCSDEELHQLFPDCQSELIPPLGGAFRMKCVIDTELLETDGIYFPSGRDGLFIYAKGADFTKLHKESVSLSEIAHRPPPSTAGANDDGDADTLEEEKRSAVRAIEELPPMPGLAMDILNVRNEPYSNAADVAQIIERDPSLAAQMLRYARSPLYGYRGKIDSVETAIVRVLGLDLVQNIALGITLGKQLRNPLEGPLGLRAYWYHAILCASLCQELCKAINYQQRPSVGTAYLAGLLHNIGFLLLGHLFTNQWQRLNDAVTANGQRAINEIEEETIGMTHNQVGIWLMEAWEMPEEIGDVVRYHHDSEYHGEFAVYVNLVIIANTLLATQDIGDGQQGEISQEMLERTGLERERVNEIFAGVMENAESLGDIAKAMAP